MVNYIILTPFFPNSSSFRGSYLFDQAKQIQSKSEYKLTVVILSPFFSKSFFNYTIEGIRCVSFKVIDFPSFILPGFFHKINTYRFNLFLNKNRIHINNDSIIHGHINYPSLNFLCSLSNSFGAKTILQHHGLDIIQKDTGIHLPILKNIQNNIILKRFKKLSSNINLHIAVSSFVKAQLIKLNSDLEDKVHVCINGVDTSKFYKLENQQKNKFIIGCVANFWTLKDQISLLKAINILTGKGINDIVVKFVGSGPTLEGCKEYANTYSLNCEFINELSHNKLIYFYNQLNLFVLPSYYEAFGCVYLEALACGVPFVGVKGQGIEDIVEEKNKSLQLVNSESPLDLSKSILYFYENKTTITFNSSYKIENTVKQMLSKINQI